jgi:hypothetical protein
VEFFSISLTLGMAKFWPKHHCEAEMHELNFVGKGMGARQVYGLYGLIFLA